MKELASPPRVANALDRLESWMPRPPHPFVLCLVLLALSGLPCLSQEGPTAPAGARPTPAICPARIQRLAEAAKLWGRLKWVHPALADGTVNWDEALLEALPAFDAADTEAQRAEALRKLLAPLKDPGARIGPPLDPVWVKADPKADLVAWLPGEVLLVRLNREVGPFLPGYDEALQKLTAALPRAKGLVLDLRPATPPMMGVADAVTWLVERAITAPVDLPATRFIYNHGYAPQTFSSSGGYFRSWLVKEAVQLHPAQGAKALPMAFIMNPWTPIPPSALALQKARRAFLVAEGQPDLGWVLPTETRKVGASLEATYSVGDLIYPDGTFGFGMDTVLPVTAISGPEAPAVKAALDLLASGRQPGAAVTWAPRPQTLRPEREEPYRAMAFPELGYRRLAVIRLWTVIDAFYPYKGLLDRPWDEALPEYLARMEAVADGKAYALALAEMAARLEDNHVWVLGHPALKQLYGAASLPLQFRRVEGRVVVATITDAQAAGGIHLWDEVREIDGVPVAKILQAKAPYFPAANPWSHDRLLVSLLGRGEDGSTAQLTLADARNRVYQATLKRSRTYPSPEASASAKPVTALLPGHLGYADLTRLQVADVDALFEQIRNTRGLILDMRGYPNGTAWAIAPRLNVRHATEVATFFPSIVTGDGSDQIASSRLVFKQAMPPGNGKPLYRGKVVMLMDERAVSQAEHSGLLFESACDITFIGSPTAGSNGDVTSTILPGGITVSFTGQGVEHTDGRQLQRIGLQPRISAKPTLRGLRAGKDEVLDRAIRFLTQGH